ncbi:hypothetical protein F4678DRAFT_454006 [Xylaria arbuscula]|nr:hypothetical protein F4678DRAFT_454006 [Xylaria arbuscula]
MMHEMADDDDSQNTLLEISRHYRQPIVPLLLRIQSYNKRQEQSISFLESLECFKIGDIRKDLLFRKRINAFEETNYVALSYTWNPSAFEDEESGDYFIQDRSRKGIFRAFSSPVRNCVFDRITKYMTSQTVDLLWIDRHSIPQRPYKTVSGEKRDPLRKRQGLQCMDWVYKLSDHPVALLSRPLASRREMVLLHRILMGGIPVRASMTKRQYDEILEALKLLYAITDDIWWQRAWTFQENYKGGIEMTLLVPHSECDEEAKRRLETFGNIPGELCVNSSKFSRQSTQLCLDFRSTFSPRGKIQRMLRSILRRAGKYKILLRESQPMSPIIITDVEKRGVADVWDRLPIVGNCCSYLVRMDIEQLRKRQHSLSLSLLTMCLLNGEILNNALPNEQALLNVTTSSFLKTQIFDKISAPTEEKSLTFNKGCRFINVQLTESGILTSGHLWKLGWIIHTNRYRYQLPWVQKSGGSLTRVQRQYLTLLCQTLWKSPRSRALASYITTYLDGDTKGKADFEFGENYMRMMMIEVARAMEAGKKLRLGTLDNSRESTAIFIWEGSRRTPGFVFTSSQPKNLNTGNYINNDIDNHVSLEVDRRLNTEHGIDNLPFLYVKRWVLGVCFFVGYGREKVIFPWPRAMAG